MLVRGLPGLARVAADGAHVFWIQGPLDGQRVGRIDPDGSHAVSFPTPGHPEDLALDADRVYVSLADPNGLATAPKAAPELTVLAEPRADNPGPIAIHGDRIAWLDLGSGGSGQVLVVRRSGDTFVALPPLPVAPTGAEALEIDDSDAYWLAPRDGLLVTRSLSESVPGVALVASGAGPFSLTSDATTLYWTELGGQVRALDKTACTPRTIASGDSPSPIVVDDRDVFWAERSGRILRAPKGGGPTTIVAEAGGQPSSLALDAEYLYWVDVRSAAIMRTPK
jgi:streptogramin lyase